MNYNDPINVEVRERDSQWREILERYLPQTASSSIAGPQLLDNVFKRDIIPLMQAAINLSIILHELEARGIELSEGQDDKWFGATEIIERLRKGLGQ